MEPQLNLIQQTNQLFQHLLNNQKQCLAIIKRNYNVREMVNQLLIGKAYGYSYSNQVKNLPYKEHFVKLQNLKQSISSDQYQRQLTKIRQELINAIKEQHKTFELLNNQVPYQFTNSKPNQNNNSKDSLKKSMPILPPPSNNFQQIKKPEITQSSQFNKKPVQQKKEQINPKQNNPKPSQIPQINNPIVIKPKQVFKGSDLIVVIRYFDLTANFNYDYKITENNKDVIYKIESQLKVLLQQYFSKQTITVKSAGKEIRVLEDTNYVKSQDAGNYSFDPFCNSMQIIIKRNDNKQFTDDFTVQPATASQFKLQPLKITRFEDWSKSIQKLHPKSSIQDLMDAIRQKRQSAKQSTDLVVKILNINGQAIIAQDLFSWSISQFERLNIKATFIHQIIQMVEIIKDCSRLGTQKSYSQKKRQCLRVANSHKILRYLLYKNYGLKACEKLPWLNLKNIVNAVKIVKEQIHNEELLDKLNVYFEQFGLDPNNDPIKFSRGMVLYGPPGTGKTVLTQSLPDIMGFHLIQKGLSAADFMKTNVGQASRMIRDLVNRANYSPHLLCSVGIDQVDGLVPDRKDKQQKNKGQGISMLLSVIGGNKDVPNLVFMASTNYLKKIDEAIRRRLSGQFQVGRPSPQARQKIILSKVKYLKDQKKLLQILITITANFTGAALGGVSTALISNLRKKQMQKKKIQLTQNDIYDTVILMARQFSITLGVYTLAQIYKNQRQRKNILTKKFLGIVGDNLVAIQKLKEENLFVLAYPNKVIKSEGGKSINLAQIEEQKFSINLQRNKNSSYFSEYLASIFLKDKVRQFVCQTVQIKQTFDRIMQQIKRIHYRDDDNPYVFVIVIHGEKQPSIGGYLNQILSAKKPNIYIVVQLSSMYDRKQFLSSIYGKSEDIKKQLNYSGRIFVQLQNQLRLAFQLKNSANKQSKIAFKLFMQSQESNNSKDVIPELVNFFTKQQVSYILLLDYQLLLQNDAFQEKKMLQIMEQKMTEAKNYQRAAVMINADSLITLTQSASDSSMGRSMSYSIANHNIYQILMNYMSEFAMVNQKSSKWISIIGKNQQLIKKIKNDLSWPKYPEEQKKQEQEKKKDQDRRCLRCKVMYKERKNQQERTCMGHPGKIVDIKNGFFQQARQVQQLKSQLIKNKARKAKQKPGKDKDNAKDQQNPYYFTCCQKNIDEAGCTPFFHFSTGDQDQLQTMRTKNQDKWEIIRSYLCD